LAHFNLQKTRHTTQKGSGGEWLFSVKVIDEAKPILTEVVKKDFSLTLKLKDS
jgi:hypothetical protein